MDLFDLIGPVMIGPSSSHTAGAARIGLTARLLLGEEVVRAEIGLHGSFAKTYRGHGTDRVLLEVLGKERTEIVFCDYSAEQLPHPNTMDFFAYQGEEQIGFLRVLSIGGGDIVVDGEPQSEAEETYPENSFAEIQQFCAWRYISLSEYVELN